MSLYLSMGKLKGKPLKKLVQSNYGKSISEIRPTVSMARSVLFNVLMHNNELGCKIEDAEVLDLCAGTGIVGFEFLSLGAKKVTFLDSCMPAIKNIKKSAHIIGCQSQIKTLNYSLPKAFAANSYDIVFFDAPYDSRAMIHTQFDILLRKNVVKSGGVIVIETDRSFDFAGEHKKFAAIMEQGYLVNKYLERQVNSKTKLYFFKVA